MKKLILTAFATCAILGANAADYKVVTDGALADGLNYYAWHSYPSDWNANILNDGVAVFKAGDDKANASGGIHCPEKGVTGKLNSATLNVEWKYEGTAGATYNVRLTADGAVEQDHVLVASAEPGDYVVTTLDIATDFANISNAWKNAEGRGDGYVFAIVLTNGKDDSVLDIKNVWYSNVDEAWTAPDKPVLPAPTTVPVPEQASEDVVSVISTYPGGPSFGLPYWGQNTLAEKVEIDGAPVLKLENFNYQGLDGFNLDATKCNYLHVDYWTPDGETFGITPISPGPKEMVYNLTPVEKETWNSYDVKLTTWSMVDFADVFQIKFDNGGGATGYVANLYFYHKEEEAPKPGDGEVYEGSISGVASQDMGEAKEYPYTIEYKATFNKDNTVTVDYKYVWSDGEPIGIVPGSVTIDGEEHGFAAGDTLTYTTTKTFEKGEKINIRFFAAYALGALEQIVSYTVGDILSQVAVEGVGVVDGPVEYYTIQGVRVANPERGLYIRVQEGKATKVIL